MGPQQQPQTVDEKKHMKHAPNNRRSRRSNGRRGNQNVRNQTFESNGPEGRIRGTAQQVLEKYLVLARDAASAGEHIQAEAFYQHAEHYFRLLNSDPNYQNRQGEQRRPTPADSDPASYSDDDDRSERQDGRDRQDGGDRQDRGDRQDGGSGDQSKGDGAGGREPAGMGEQPDVAAAGDGPRTDESGDGRGRGRSRRRGNNGPREIPIESADGAQDSGPSDGGSAESSADAAVPDASAEGAGDAPASTPPAEGDDAPRKRGRGRPKRDTAEAGDSAPAAAPSEDAPAAE